MKRLICFVFTLAFLFACPATAWQDGDIVGIVSELASGPNEPGGANVRSTALGSIVADAVAYATGADLAIVNAADLYQNLVPGQITWESVVGIFSQNRQLATALVTPAELRDILEAGLWQIVIGQDDAIDQTASAFDGFPQLGGFSIVYDGSAPSGSRVMSITLEDGTELAMDDNYTVLTLAASQYMLSGGYEMIPFEHSELELTLADALALAIADGVLDTADAQDRIKVVGTTDDKLINGYLLAAVVLASVLIGFFRYKGTAYFDYSRNNTEKTHQFDRERKK